METETVDISLALKEIGHLLIRAQRLLDDVEKQNRIHEEKGYVDHIRERLTSTYIEHEAREKERLASMPPLPVMETKPACNSAKTAEEAFGLAKEIANEQ